MSMQELESFGSELADDLLPQLRVLAESRMRTGARIYRKTLRHNQDETTGLDSPIWELLYDDLLCRVTDGGRGSRPAYTTNTIAGGLEQNAATPAIHLPIDPWLDLVDGDHVEIITGTRAGSVFKILEVTGSDQKTARRLPTEAVDRPLEWGSWEEGP